MSQSILDLEYAHIGRRPLLLDLYLPDDAQRPWPLILWVHGGAWRMGDRRTGCHALRMVARGYAVASISYRLSQEAIFPAQIHDCKAAVRWLRAQAAYYGFDAHHIGAWGPSAGGHLVAMLGTTAGVPELEGNEGNLEVSSSVQAVCDWFGPTDFLRMDDESPAPDHALPDSPESQLIGGPITEHPEWVKRASPLTYITGHEPPFLIMHGDQDRTVIHGQSVLLYESLRRVGVEVTLHTLRGAGHGGAAFDAPEVAALVDAFFDRHLKD